MAFAGVRRALWGGLVTFLAVVFSGGIAAAATPDAPQAVPNQLVVGYDGGLGVRARAELRRRLGMPRVRTVSGDDPAEVVRVGARSADELMALAHQIARLPGIAYAEPNWYVHPDTVPSDEFFARYQWSLRNTGSFEALQGGKVSSAAGADIGAPRAWDVTMGAPNVVVGLVDTGIFSAHEDLDNQIWTNPAETKNGKDDDGNGKVDDIHGWDFVSDDARPDDDVGHGTHVAGIIAGEANGRGTVGIAPGVRILPVRGIKGSGTDIVTAAEGVRYAASQGAHVVNMSWGTFGDSHALARTIYSYPGTLFVASAGNNGTNNDTTLLPYFPCTLPAPNLVCVAASDPFDRRVSRSSYGPTSVGVAAPGEAIVNADGRPGYRGSGADFGRLYRYAEGTSMAAAHVSGIAALMGSGAPWSKAIAQKACLISGSEPVAGFKGLVAGGRANAFNALYKCGDQVAPNVPAKPLAPRDGERVRPQGLAFRFTPGSDALSGVVSNTVVIDGRPAAASRAARVKLRQKPRLRDGRHFWLVRSADKFGNTADSRTHVLYVDGTGPRMRARARRSARRVRLAVRLGERSRLTARVLRGRRPIEVRKSAQLARGRHSFVIPLTRGVRRAARRGRLTIVIRATDTLGNATAKRLSVRLRG